MNLLSRRSMSDARAHLDEDADEWALIASLCRDLTLRWGGNFPNRDLFHIEWHPGFGGRLKPEQLERFLEAAGRHGRAYRKTWKLFEPPGGRP